MKTTTNFIFRVFSTLSMLAVLFGSAGRIPTAHAAPAAETNALSVEQLLNPDGTLNLDTGYSGVLDAENFNINLDPVTGPTFEPLGTPNVWNPMGSGIAGDYTVNAIAVSGSDVYIGGTFTNAGGVDAADYIARWNGSAWSGLGATPLNAAVRAITVSGSDVYVGGHFTNAGGVDAADYIAKWNGASWSALGTTPLNNGVLDIAVSGSDVYVGGFFTNAGGVAAADYLAKWNGASWSALGTTPLDNVVYTIAVSGSDVYVGGVFGNTGGPSYLRKWNGTAWSALGTTPLNNGVTAIAVSGTDVYVGGYFTEAGGIAEADYIAKWDGASWSALGSMGLNSNPEAIAAVGSDVYVGGFFTLAGGVSGTSRIAKWSTSTNSWSAVGGGLNNYVLAIAVNGGDVYAGGYFTDAGGNANGDRIARFEVPGATIVVDTHLDNFIYNDGLCSLREAIMSADGNTAIDTCQAGLGPDTILFADDLDSNTITLTSNLPGIYDSHGLTIDGGSDITISGDDLYSIFLVSTSLFTLKNATVSDANNSFGPGGAISIDRAQIIILNSTIRDNISLYGSAIDNFGGSVVVGNSTFTSNTATNVNTGIINNTGAMIIYNSTFSGNYGGAISNYTAMAIYNSTFSGNNPSTGYATLTTNGTLQLYNTIIANSLGSGVDCGGSPVSGTNNLIESDDCGFANGVNGNIIGSDPALGSLAGSPAYFTLNAGSPAINTGSNAVCAAAPVYNQSQNGLARPQGSNCEIGSFELLVATPTSLVNSVLPTSRTPVVGSPVTIFNTIVNAGASTAYGVTLSMNPAPAGTFSYNQTDCNTNAIISGPNPAVNITPGGIACYVLSFTPSAPFAATQVHIRAQASNASATTLLPGINTWLLRSTSSQGPDIIALSTTTDFHQVACSGLNVFAVALSNVGMAATGDITVSANTGTAALPVAVSIQETNPNTGAIIGDNILNNLGGGQNRTVAVFVTFNGCINFNPAANRIFIEFRDANNNVVGSTSTAVSTNR